MIAIALPMVVSQSCDTVMIFTDRLFLSKLGPEQMNAAMGGGLTSFMMMSFFIGLTSYSTALVAQYLGAGRKQDCPLAVSQTVILSLIAYLPILACRPLAHGLFEIMGISSAQLVPQKTYFDILLYGIIIGLLRTSLSSFFSGIGRTGIVMIASFTAMIVNVILNYIFVFGKFGCPSLGIKGAAYGTILGGISGLLVLAISYFRKSHWVEFALSKSFRFDKEVMKKLLRFGSPTGAEMFLNILAFNAMVMTFHAHGLVTATAATIVLNWDLVSFVPLIGVEIGVMSLVGRSMGAGDPDSAHRAAMSGLKLGLVYSFFILILFVGFPSYLVNMFRPAGSGEVFYAAFPAAMAMLRLASLYVMVEALFIVFIGALRGAGDTLWAMGMSVGLHWFMASILFVMLRVLGMSPVAGWGSVVVLFLIFSGIVFLRYRSGQWRKIRIVDTVRPAMAGDGFHEPVDL